MEVVSYIIGWLIGIVAIVVGAISPAGVVVPPQFWIAFGIATILAVTWLALWQQKGTFGFDISSMSIFAKWSALSEIATLPIIAIYVIAFIIAAVIH